jgi:hypothetical protein
MKVEVMELWWADVKVLTMGELLVKMLVRKKVVLKV